MQAKPAGALVSIIIPCYNYARFVGEAIESALGQSYSPVEVLVMDDGSTDDTAGVVRRYAKRGVGYAHQANAGPGAARNAGLKLAKGELVLFLDADDVLEPEYVAECLQALEAHPNAGFAYTQVRWFGGRTGISQYPDYSRAELVRGNYIHVSALMKRELAEQHPYDEGMRRGWEDWNFYLTLAEHGVGGVLVDAPLLRYRIHGEPQSINANVVGAREQQMAHRRIMQAHPSLYPWYTRLKFWLYYFRLRSKAWLKRRSSPKQ